MIAMLKKKWQMYIQCFKFLFGYLEKQHCFTDIYKFNSYIYESRQKTDLKQFSFLFSWDPPPGPKFFIEKISIC